MRDEDATLLAVDADPRLPADVAGAQALGESEGDDHEEVEHDGQFYRIPRALKGAFLMHGDYTRKTQELGEHRRALEAQRRAHAEEVELAQADIGDRARLHLLDQQIEEYQGVDWETFGQADPQGAQAVWAEFTQTQQMRDQFAWSLTHRTEQGRLEAQRRAAEQLAETGRVLSQEIDGWSPEVAAKLVEYAGAFGVTLEELREIADPRLWKILHRAHLGEQMEKQQASAKTLAQSQAVRPAISVTGAAVPSGAVRDEMATGDWIRRRNEQALKGR